MLGAVTVEIDDTAVARTATFAAGAATVPAAGDELPEGLRLGHFRIERKLGAGGMGEVYLATDLALDRPVAIKVLPAGTTSGAARERLIREARAQARIQHPNVAHIYFIGEDHGRLYFAMEYVAGKTLAERAAAGPLAVEDALEVIRSAALGLREAQRSGFTHRDVKPSNLMADAHGVVKVLDFGLVAAAPTGPTGDTAASGPVAQTSFAGTPLYMAPEQARGEPIDLRADIYALGATLYHLVSGQPPFVAETVDELVSMHATAARPHVPRKGHARTAIAAIDQLFARMMAPDPDDRFASYDELLRELELASTQHTRPAGVTVRSIATGIDFLSSRWSRCSSRCRSARTASTAMSATRSRSCTARSASPAGARPAARPCSSSRWCRPRMASARRCPRRSCARPRCSGRPWRWRSSRTTPRTTSISRWRSWPASRSCPWSTPPGGCPASGPPGTGCPARRCATARHAGRARRCYHRTGCPGHAVLSLPWQRSRFRPAHHRRRRRRTTARRPDAPGKRRRAGKFELNSKFLDMGGCSPAHI